MAIKIIKQGTKEFHITCPYCGCEFTYENEDVCNSEVICPCCLTNLPHKGVIGTVGTSPSLMPIWYNQQVSPDGYKIRGGFRMRLGTIPELSSEQLEKKFPRKGYCITFYPVEDGSPDLINSPQIFVKLTESKAKELAELFERTNKKNDGLKITIEIFEIGDENS